MRGVRGNGEREGGRRKGRREDIYGCIREEEMRRESAGMMIVISSDTLIL